MTARYTTTRSLDRDLGLALSTGRKVRALLAVRRMGANRAVDVVVLVGSLRKGSFSRMLANALVELAKPSLDLEVVEIGGLPLYNEDLDPEPPEAWTAFRTRVKKADAVLFVTPEYNRSVPAVLKNALDVGSRPQGENAWAKKPGGVVSVTPHQLGGFGANHHLRQALVYLDVPTMQQPEAYISKVGDAFDRQGKLTDDEKRALLKKFVSAYAEWVKRFVD